MKIARWIALLPASLLMNLAAYPMAPIIATLDACGVDVQRWFSWFCTPDNPLTGDGGHDARHEGSSRWWRITTWLWRNKSYGFDASVLRARPARPWLNVKGDRLTGNHPLREGYCLRRTLDGYWQFYYVRRLGKRCLRVNLGWKLWDASDAPLFGAYVFSVNPFMGYTE